MSEEGGGDVFDKLKSLETTEGAVHLSGFEAFLLLLVFLGVALSIAKFVKSKCGRSVQEGSVLSAAPSQTKDIESGNARIDQFWGEEPSQSPCQKLVAKWNSRSRQENCEESHEQV